MKSCFFPFCLGVLLASPLAAQNSPAVPWLLEPSSGVPNKLYWQTEPGQRYDLWKSTDLRDWDRVAGFPKVAEGLAMEHAFAPHPGGKEFFQIEPIDEQVPVVVSQYPQDGGFAVGRFANIVIELEDASGIDFDSMMLSYGIMMMPILPDRPGLTIEGNTITWDSGDAPLGDWGETIDAQLIIRDTLGNTLTHTWSFRLEPEPVVAENVFVFGSPTSQRAGQRVEATPTAALAMRFPAPAGPVRANDPPEWSIDLVAADRIVIAYGADGPPAFAADHLVCNLAPSSEAEIFYRRVLSAADNPATSRLTLMTEEAPLTDFIVQGAAALSEDSVFFDFNESGNLSRAFSFDRTFTFPRIGYDLSGSTFKLRSDGFEATVLGVTHWQGSAPTFLEVTTTQHSWWFTPRIQTTLEIGGGDLKAFEAIASGDLAVSYGFAGQVNLPGVTTERTLYELPAHQVPKRIVYLGNVGMVPVFAVLSFEFKIKSVARAEVALAFHGLYQQGVSAAYGLSYRQGKDVEWVRSFQTTPAVLEGDAGLAGEFSWKLSLEPEVKFLVQGLAGIKAGLVPSGGVVVSSSGGDPKLCLEGSLDFTIAPDVHPMFGEIATGLSFGIWSGKSCGEFSFTTHPESQTVKEGRGVNFSCVVDVPAGSREPEFQWYHNGSPVPGQKSRSLFLHHVKQGYAGSYHVTATLGDVTLESEVAVLTMEGEQGPISGEFALIPAGSFSMGDSVDGFSNELPVRTVYVSTFYMGRYEVTKALWDEVKAWGEINGYKDWRYSGYGKGGDHPVMSISWYDAVKWCNARSEKEGLTPCYSYYVNAKPVIFRTGEYPGVNYRIICDWNANGYRLPTEAEWEKAARGKLVDCRFPWGNTINHNYANYRSYWRVDADDVYRPFYGGDIATKEGYHPLLEIDPYAGLPAGAFATLPVGSFAPNGYGLYDVAGNVHEWCWDWRLANYNSLSEVDPRGPWSGYPYDARVYRGGESSWWSGAHTCRVAYRGARGPRHTDTYVGFRLARSSVP